jgi:hypothetical protein
MQTNSYPALCNNPNCKTYVPVNEGVRKLIDGSWVCFCKKCGNSSATSPARKPLVKRRELVVSGNEGKVFVPYEPRNLPLLNSMPGSRWNPVEKCWQVSLAEQDRIRLLEITDKLQIEVPAELRIRENEQAELASFQGLYEFQVQGVNWLSRREKAILGDDMGLGKTIQTLMSLPKESRVLVVAPRGLAYSWKKEILRWRPDYTLKVSLGNKKDFCMPKENQIIVTSFGSIPDSFLPPPRKSKKWESYSKELKEFREENTKLYPEIT